jgi:hypothetical protein
MLAGRVRTPIEGALVGVAALAFEEELHALPATHLTNRTVITSHLEIPLI